jgi:hypothetical protein
MEAQNYQQREDDILYATTQININIIFIYRTTSTSE